MSADNDNLEQYRVARQDELRRLSRDERHVYSRVSRRRFIGATAAATLASLVGYEPKRLDAAGQAKPGARPGATADAVIVLWMAGGMASTETFDPKRYTPFAPGVPIKDVLSTFPRIDTNVDHIKFTQGLENIAGVMDKGTIIRGFTAAPTVAAIACGVDAANMISCQCGCRSGGHAANGKRPVAVTLSVRPEGANHSRPYGRSYR